MVWGGMSAAKASAAGTAAGEAMRSSATRCRSAAGNHNF
jgi:hypothetical protein